MSRTIRSSTFSLTVVSAIIMTMPSIAIAQDDTPRTGTTTYEFRTEAEVDEYPQWAKGVVSQGQLAVFSLYGPVEVADVISRLVSTMHDRLGTIESGQTVVWNVTVQRNDDDGAVMPPIRAMIGGDALSVEWYSPFRILRTTRGRIHGSVDLSASRTIQPEVKFSSDSRPTIPDFDFAYVSATVTVHLKGPTGAADGWLSLEDFGLWRVQNGPMLAQLGRINLRPKSSGTTEGRFVERQEGRLHANAPGATLVAVRAMHDLQDLLVDLVKTETDWEWSDAACELRAVPFDNGRSIVLLWRLIGTIEALEGGIVVGIDLPLYAALVEYDSKNRVNDAPADANDTGIVLFPMNPDTFALDAERAYRTGNTGTLLHRQPIPRLGGPVTNALSLELFNAPDLAGEFEYIRLNRERGLVVIGIREPIEDGDNDGATAVKEHELVTVREE